MRDRRAEQPGEGLVTGFVEVVLPAEEDDLVGEEGAPDLGDGVGGQVTGEPDPADLGTDAAAEPGDGGGDGSGHGSSLGLFPQRKKKTYEDVRTARRSRGDDVRYEGVRRAQAQRRAGQRP